MNYVTEQANKSVTQRTRRCMAAEVAGAIPGHHSLWSKKDCQSGSHSAIKDARFGKLFQGK